MEALPFAPQKIPRIAAGLETEAMEALPNKD
jgi:hypothetical protein